jgi:hypothetical protein
MTLKILKRQQDVTFSRIYALGGKHLAVNVKIYADALPEFLPDRLQKRSGLAAPRVNDAASLAFGDQGKKLPSGKGYP